MIWPMQYTYDVFIAHTTSKTKKIQIQIGFVVHLLNTTASC